MYALAATCERRGILLYYLFVNKKLPSRPSMAERAVFSPPVPPLAQAAAATLALRTRPRLPWPAPALHPGRASTATRRHDPA